tara:strand:- start:1157 stop:1462 length:306 start_codon:yes stop_codon:yes gene_type:complete
MEVIVWSTGEKYSKSNKNEKPILNSNNEIIHNVIYRSECLNKKTDRETELKNELKREELMERCMTSQSFQNPFLSKNFNDVLVDQEKYLIPQNSNFIEKNI